MDHLVIQVIIDTFLKSCNCLAEMFRQIITVFNFIQFPLDEVHETALTWLTHTFLTLSIACMITTIVIYSVYWK